MARSWPVLVLCVALGLTFAESAESSMSDAAYSLLAERVAANRTQFFVYADTDSGLNHGFPSGLFGNAIGKVSMDPACVDDPGAPMGCSTDPRRLDRQRGTVLRVSFGPLLPGEFAGVNIEEPENWGGTRPGTGYDLRGATHVMFDIRSPTLGGIEVQFGVGGRTTAFVRVEQSATYTSMSISLASLGLSPADLADTHVLFTVVTNVEHAPQGGTVLLDRVRFGPVPASQTSRIGALSFPLSTQSFGVVPLQSPGNGRVPIPLDQLLRNVTTVYESALTLLALLQRGTGQDLVGARAIADTFRYALDHDNRGLLLPTSVDGSRGLHSAYESGDIALFNTQSATTGAADDVRLAGFTASTGLCGPSGFCLVLDGATGGNNAFAILALAAAYQRFNDVRYLDAARTIGNWIAGILTDTSGTGYGGYYLGFSDGGLPKVLIKGKSVENNADIFTAFSTLAEIETMLGNHSQATEWTRRANVAGDFVVAMFDGAAGRFYAGTVPAGAPPGVGIKPDGPQAGADVINTFDVLDANTFTTLALGAAPRYRSQIDWRRPIQFVLDHFTQSVTASGRTFSGLSLVTAPTAGPDGVAWEFTGQAVVAMRFVDLLYRECRFDTTAAFYLDQIRAAQFAAPFGDGFGLVAATLQDGDTLAPIEQCLSTPFQCVPERVGLGATVWAIFAELNVNPLAKASDLPDVKVTLTPSTAHLGDRITLGLSARNPGPAFVADFYLGVVLPDGTTLCFLTSLSPAAATCLPLSSDPRTFPALAGSVQVPDGLDVSLPEIFAYTFMGSEPVGPYVFFAVLTPPGAFADGSAESCELLFFSTASSTYLPGAGIP